MNNIGIIGCGWLGKRIADYFSSKHHIFTTTTSIEKIEGLEKDKFNPTLVNFSDEEYPRPRVWYATTALDVLIIAIPLSKIKTENTVVFTKRFSEFIGKFSGQVIFMSSTGVYPDEDKEFHESDTAVETVLSERMIRNIFPWCNILRLAGLMGDNRLLKYYKVTHLNSPVNHVHFADVCRIVEKIIELNLKSEVYNVVAPLHPSKKQVLREQDGIPQNISMRTPGRTICGNKVISELEYTFMYPDPCFFHI